MNAKILLPVIAAAMTLEGDNFTDPGPIANGTVRRFELVQGPDPTAGARPTMFRIDTFTGKVWELTSMPARAVPNASFMVWSPINEDGGKMFKAMMADPVPKGK